MKEGKQAPKNIPIMNVSHSSEEGKHAEIPSLRDENLKMKAQLEALYNVIKILGGSKEPI
jgi:hypothetical protein